MKRVALVLFLILSVISLVPHPSAAQTDKPKCDLTGVSKQVAAFKPSGDAKADLAALLKVRDAISQANVDCNGWTFSAKTGSKLIGPFILPKGVYKITATTTGYLIVRVQQVDPECDQYKTDYGIVNVAKGEANDGAESIETFENTCKIFLQPDNVSAPWTLTIEPVQ
jgi:hypothetical protein